MSAFLGLEESKGRGSRRPGVEREDALLGFPDVGKVDWGGALLSVLIEVGSVV